MHNEIEHIVEILRRGGTILYPTDTIWGIGCDATNPDAVKKVKDIKQRADAKSFLVLCRDMEQVAAYAAEIPPEAMTLHSNSNKPTTIIYPKIKNISTAILATDGSLGIRIPNFDFCNELLKAFGRPIVSTSANRSGEASPLSFNDISDEVKLAVDYVVKDFHNYISPFAASRIVKLNNSGEITVLRD